MLYDAEGNIITSRGERKKFSSMAVMNELLKDVYAPYIRAELNRVRKTNEEYRLEQLYASLEDSR